MATTTVIVNNIVYNGVYCISFINPSPSAKGFVIYGGVEIKGKNLLTGERYVREFTYTEYIENCKIIEEGCSRVLKQRRSDV